MLSLLTPLQIFGLDILEDTQIAVLDIYRDEDVSFTVRLVGGQSNRGSAY